MIKLVNLLKSNITEAMDVPPPPAIIQKADNPSTNITQNLKDSYILAATLWGEARGEGTKGMQAVMNVIMNRAGGKFDKARDVALKRKQFSFWNSIPNPDKYAQDLAVKARNDKLQDSDKFKKAVGIVDLASKGKLKDITGGATFYFNPKLANPSWAKDMEKTKSIGHHDFYKPKTSPSKRKIDPNLAARVAASMKTGHTTH